MALAKRTGAFTSYGVILSTYTGSGNYFQFTFSNMANQGGFGTSGFCTFTQSDNAFHIFQGVVPTSGNSTVNLDGVTTSCSVGNTASGTAIGFGRHPDAGDTTTMTGDLEEGGIANAGWGSGLQAAICHNEYAYWGTATSC